LTGKLAVRDHLSDEIIGPIKENMDQANCSGKAQSELNKIEVDE
jgi:hypothetical protein